MRSIRMPLIIVGVVVVTVVIFGRRTPKLAVEQEATAARREPLVLRRSSTDFNPFHSSTDSHPLHPSTDSHPLEPTSARPFEGNEFRSTAHRYHRVIDGDTLEALAQHYLGDVGRAREIFQSNRDVLSSPDVLPLGTVLLIPTTGSLPLFDGDCAK